MKRSTILGGAAAVLAALAWLALAGSPPATETAFTDSFEDGLAAWDTGTDLPRDPNTPAPDDTVNWTITTTDRVAATGNRSALFMIDGSQDDGTVWLHRTFPVTPGNRYDVTVSASAWSEIDSFNQLASMVLYAGTEAPTREESFPRSGSTVTSGAWGGLRAPLHAAEGWKEYTVTWTTPVLDTGTLHAAVGMSVVWETPVAVPYDDVSIVIEPAS